MAVFLHYNNPNVYALLKKLTHEQFYQINLLTVINHNSIM